MFPTSEVSSHFALQLSNNRGQFSCRMSGKQNDVKSLNLFQKVAVSATNFKTWGRIEKKVSALLLNVLPVFKTFSLSTQLHYDLSRNWHDIFVSKWLGLNYDIKRRFATWTICASPHFHLSLRTITQVVFNLFIGHWKCIGSLKAVTCIRVIVDS